MGARTPDISHATSYRAGVRQGQACAGDTHATSAVCPRIPGTGARRSVWNTGAPIATDASNAANYCPLVQENEARGSNVDGRTARAATAPSAENALSVQCRAAVAARHCRARADGQCCAALNEQANAATAAAAHTKAGAAIATIAARHCVRHNAIAGDNSAIAACPAASSTAAARSSAMAAIATHAGTRRQGANKAVGTATTTATGLIAGRSAVAAGRPGNGAAGSCRSAIAVTTPASPPNSAGAPAPAPAVLTC